MAVGGLDPLQIVTLRSQCQKRRVVQRPAGSALNRSAGSTNLNLGRDVFSCLGETLGRNGLQIVGKGSRGVHCR